MIYYIGLNIIDFLHCIWHHITQWIFDIRGCIDRRKVGQFVHPERGKDNFEIGQWMINVHPKS